MYVIGRNDYGQLFTQNTTKQSYAKEVEKDKEEGHFEAAHNREMALRCFVNFLGKEELSLNELTPELMVKFEEWLNTKGRKQSTTRLYLYQISSVYNYCSKRRNCSKT